MSSQFPLRVLDGPALRRWAFRSRAALGTYRSRLDGLNVFPVADNDTGTNLALSLRGGLDAIARSGALDARGGLATGAGALSRSLLLAARGNSGAILGLLVSGLAEVFESPATERRGPRASGRRRDVGDVDAQTLAKAMTRAAQRAWEGVDDPVEGTILTVARAAAEAATVCANGGGDLASTVRAADAAARQSLARTPEELGSHATAGVVDAGGAGLVVVLAALTEVVTGEAADVDLPSARRSVPSQAAATAGGRYEVMYALQGCTSSAAARVRERLAELGDSLVVAGDDDLRSVHVHTDDPGAAIEAALDVAQVRAIRVEWLGGEVATPAVGHRSVEPERGGTIRPRGIGLLAYVDGPDLAVALRAAGVVVPQVTPPVSAQDVLDAARTTGAHDVVVLAVEPDAWAAVETASRVVDDPVVRLHLVAVTSPVHVLAAVSVVAPDAEREAIPVTLERMRAAAEHVRAGLVLCTPSTPSVVGAPPDVVGIVPDTGDTGQEVYRGEHVAGAVEALVEALCERWGHDDPPEVVTLVTGAGCAAGVDELVRDIEMARPHLEVRGVRGGSTRYAVAVGVE